jgi:hypothetical protein
MIRLSTILCSLLWFAGCGSSARQPPASVVHTSPPIILVEPESPERNDALELTVPEIHPYEAAEDEVITLSSESLALDIFHGRLLCGSFVNHRPVELQFGCVYVLDFDEEFLAAKLKSEAFSDQLRAAQLLWRNHSRRNARDVLRFCDESNSVSPEFLKFKQECTEDCQPDQVLHELREGDYVWGTWLATLHPDSSLVPVLIDGLDQRPEARCEAIVALGKSRDPRAREALLNALRSKHDQEAGFAAGALTDFGDEAVELELLSVLDHSRTWSCANICRTLGQIGTSQSLPYLEPIADSTEYTGVINLQCAAQNAMDRIQSRLP